MEFDPLLRRWVEVDRLFSDALDLEPAERMSFIQTPAHDPAEPEPVPDFDFDQSAGA